MDKYEAGQLVKKTFESSFDRQRFVYFVKNLLNYIDESKAFHARGYIQEKYKQTAGIIKTYERIGTYTDPEENKIDVLVVYLEKVDSIERARTTLRNFAADYLKNRDEKDAGLFAFVSPNKNDWRFSLVKMEYKLTEDPSGKVKAKEKFTPAKRYSFLVGEYESSHTAQSRLVPVIADDTNNPSLKQLEDAFSVEKVTKEFFEKYTQLFHQIKDALDKLIIKDKKIKKDFLDKKISTPDFAKKLLGQIVFLYFLQKKGWFGVEKNKDWGTGSKQFLRELFKEKHGKYKNFFNNVLEPLFYQALRNDRSYDNHYFSQFNCKIPFLNGGLFDPINDYDWIKTDILLDNTLFSNDNPTEEGDVGNGILDIFDRYNFTVKEDEPLEKEVAVDPEMLGKVFENLLEVKDRKSKGTYYTPREIVHYMCQESLINYLVNECEEKVNRKDIETLIKFGDTTIEHDKNLADKEKANEAFKLPKSVIQQAQTIDDKLAGIRVCDPAVGSGAFLVGMMTEIIKARNALTSHLKNRSNLIPYDFKRQAIEKSLYGVDIDLGAVEIAKLRLWLSLIVDEDNIKNIKPLPNLDYKIMQGNSLIEFITPESLAKTTDHYRGKLIDQYNQAKQEYLSIYDPGQKKDKRDQINKLIEDIMIYDKKRQIETDKTWQKYQERQQENLFGEEKEQLALGGLSEKEKEKLSLQIEEFNKLKQASLQDHFEWHLNFNEVFQEKGGFNVVIANPPYVRVQNLSYEEIDSYKRTYRTAYKRLDLSILFLELSVNIMNSHGTAVYITSSQFTKTEYGRKIRELLTNFIEAIVYFGDNQIFESATNYTSLFFLGNNTNKETIKYTNAEKYLGTLSLNEYILSNQVALTKDDFGENPWELEKADLIEVLNKIKSSRYQALDEIADIEYGLVTGADSVFVLKNGIKELTNSRFVYSLLKPSNTDRYRLSAPTYYVIYPYKEVGDETEVIDEESLKSSSPKVYGYLLENKNKLLLRKDSRVNVNENSKFWYSLMRHSSFKKVRKEKILTQALCTHNEFCLDEEGRFFTGGSIYSICTKPHTVSNKSLLGLLNSKICEFFYQLVCPIRQHGYRFYAGTFLKTFPVPFGFLEVSQPLHELVDKILSATKNSDYLQNPSRQAKVREYERQIDQLVYKLYGLTPEEITIVEGKDENS